LELRNKLIRKGFEPSVIDSVLLQLRADNLLSDERFVESYVRTRIDKGFGPLRIQQELLVRDISDELSNGVLEINDAAWVTRARLARQKRFGQNLPQEKRELGKQFRFLQSRGFTSSQIQAVLSSN
jgi:regulatory protein